jgi:peptide/nickel transport system permease protein
MSQLTVQPPAVPPTVPGGHADEPAASPEWRRALRTAFAGRPVAWLALAWLAAVVFVSIFASHLGLPNPQAQDLTDTFGLPSAQHWLGTDSLGQDTLSRIAHGGGQLLLVALIPVALSYLIGVPLGLFGGYVGGWADTLISFYVNVLYSIPGIVVVLATAAATGNNLAAMTAVLGVFGSAGIIRLVRSSTVVTRNLLYVDAARVAQLPRRRILLRHILPNVAAPLVVQAFLAYGGIFLLLTSLAFLSLGFNPDQPSWGQITYEASQNISQHPWLMVPIGAVIILTLLAINALGSAFLRLMPSQAARDRAVKRHARRPQARPEAASDGPPSPGAPTPGAQQPDSDSAMLHVDGLSVSIPGVHGDAPLVDGVTLAARQGETLALVGESGSGKTLTALAIANLLPPEAQISSGQIALDGRVVSALSERGFRRLRGRKIAFIAQEPSRALDPCFTVRSQLTEVIRGHGRAGRAQARRRAAELLDLVGIARVEDVLRSYPHQLSGGMAQRVAIAMAISGDPELIVADEPTTALDVTVQAEILDLLRGLQERLGMTLILITHDMGVVADMADTVAVMRGGKVVETGPARHVLTEPADAYTRELLRAASAWHSPESGAEKEQG